MSTPALHQIIIRCDKALSGQVAALLENSYPEPLSVSHFEEPDQLSWAASATYKTSDDLGAARGLVEAHFSSDQNELIFETQQVEDMDWVSHVQSQLCPVEAGRFLIYGSHDRETAIGANYGIEIDAAQAFGTAHHGTTKGCLIAIDDLSQSITPPKTILDLGTGTGILAIAASLTWPDATIIASDVDPIAVDIAAANTALNNAAAITTLCADSLQDDTIQSAAPFNLLIANILARPLIAMAGEITGAVAPQGTLLLSGILDKQAKDVETAYTDAGLTHRSTSLIGEWATILFQKPH